MKKMEQATVEVHTKELVSRLVTMANKEFGPSSMAVTIDLTDTLPGQLVLEAYRMCGGRNRTMIVRAAAAIQVMVAVSQLANQEAALFITHGAMMELANLAAPADIVTKVLSITNRSALFGQQGRLQHRTDWRSVESVLNPLHVGMVLAGADCHATDAITPYVNILADPNTTSQQAIAALPHKHDYWDDQGTQFLIALANGQLF